MPPGRGYGGGCALATLGRDARKCREDAPARLNGAAQAARNLGGPAGAAAMRDRHFEDAQSGARGPHLHFNVPPIAVFPHREAHQRVAADRPERAHIGVADAVEQPHRPPDDPAGEELMGGHAAPLPLPTAARADHKIIAALGDRLDEKRDQLGAVAAVAIEKNDDVAIRGGLSAGPAGAPVATFAQADDLRTLRPRALDGAVGTAAISDNDVVDNFPRHGGKHAPDRVLFIERRNHERNSRAWHWSEAPAQPATGACSRRLVAQQCAAECLITRPVPDLTKALLGRVAQGEAVIAAHREGG